MTVGLHATPTEGGPIPPVLWPPNNPGFRPGDHIAARGTGNYLGFVVTNPDLDDDNPTEHDPFGLWVYYLAPACGLGRSPFWWIYHARPPREP